MCIYIKTNIYVGQLFDEFFLEKLTFPKDFVDNIKKVYKEILFIENIVV
jgi:hypothetical protein